MTTSAEISVRGRIITVPSVDIGGHTIVLSPGWLSMAEVKDEAWLVGDVVVEPEACFAAIAAANLKADLFTFTQKLPNTTPRYGYAMEWEDVAAIRTSDFDSWWQRVPQETRKNVRRAARRGVEVRDVQLGEILDGIVEINNESPVRQARSFWHHAKSPAQVLRDYETLVDQSVYLGAYHKTELIGFMKLVWIGEIAGILQLLCKQAHSDKRPANALLERAVAMCCARGVRYLTYGQYSYLQKKQSSLTEFKRRNGFDAIRAPRYYVPLTLKGRAGLSFGLHRGWRNLVPGSILALALNLRAAWYRRTSGHRASSLL